MGDSSDGSSSDDGGLKHVTMARARPPGSRRRMFVDHGQSDSDTDSSSGIPDNSSMASSLHVSVGLGGPVSPVRQPPRQPRPQPPLYKKGDQVQYQTNNKKQTPALITAVDTTVSPPSYVIRFSDGKERTTEEDRLSIAVPPKKTTPAAYSVSDKVIYTFEGISYVGVVDSVSAPSYSIRFEDGTVRDLQEAFLEPQPKPKFAKSQQVTYTFDGVGYKAEVQSVKVNCHPPQYDVLFENGQTRTVVEKELSSTATETPTPTPTPTPTKTAKGSQKAPKIKDITPKDQQTTNKPGNLPRPVKMCEAVSKKFPGTKAYACSVVEKISNRGFRHKRLMVLTSALLLFTKEDGELRRVVELNTIDSIFVQKHTSMPRVLVQLKASTGEPDIIFAIKSKPDPRNLPANPLSALPIIQQVCLARPPHEKVQLTEVAPGQELKDLMRVHTEKSNPRAALQRIVKEETRANNEDYDIGTNEPKAPDWKPDADAKECEICLRSFTILRRRHHCRACGGVFCGPCSSNKLLLPHVDPNTPSRVCSECLRKSMEDLRN